MLLIHKNKFGKYKRLKQHYNDNRWLFSINKHNGINIGKRL